MDCVVRGCDNQSIVPDETIKFYKFPQDPDLRAAWVAACDNPGKISLKRSRVCSEHFTDNDWHLQDVLLHSPINRRRLRHNAVPSKKLCISMVLTPRVELLQKERNKELVDMALAEYEETAQLAKQAEEAASVSMPEPEDQSPFRDAGVQTEFDLECVKELHIMSLEKRIRTMEKSLHKMQERINEADRLEYNLKRIFPPDQIQKMKLDRNFAENETNMMATVILHSPGPRDICPTNSTSYVENYQINFIDEPANLTQQERINLIEDECSEHPTNDEDSDVCEIKIEPDYDYVDETKQ